MKTRAILLALPLLVLAGCTVEERATIFIAEICGPPESKDAVCDALPDECDTIPLGHIFVDVAVAPELTLYVEVDNQVPSNENVNEGRTNSNDAWLEEYEIEYEGLPIARRSGRLPGSSYHVPAGGTAVIHLPALDAVATSMLFMDPSFIPLSTGYVDAVAHVKLKGVNGYDASFKTATFDVAFRVCDGCFSLLVPCPPPKIPIICPHPGQWPADVDCFDPDVATTT